MIQANPRPDTAADLTLRELWASALPRMAQDKKPEIPGWPPDTFALCALALRRASSYVQVLSNWPPGKKGSGLQEWAGEVARLAEEWLMALRRGEGVPALIEARWEKIVAVLDEPVRNLARPGSEAGQAVLEINSIADETMSALVKRVERTEARDEEPEERIDARMSFHRNALKMLCQNGRASFCREVHPSRIRVLPRFRVAQRGLTVRSLSLFAGLIEGDEIQAAYVGGQPTADDLTLNLLLLPWPFDVRAGQFRKSQRLKDEMGNMPPEFGFFTFDPERAKEQFFKSVVRVVRDSVKARQKIQLVVMPEMSLLPKDAKRLAHSLSKQNCGLVCGLGSGSIPGRTHGVNQVGLFLPGVEDIAQDKHHRWKLDSSQIRQYALGEALSAEMQWWEHINIASRRLDFVRLHSWLTLCVLICEDLARPDPAGDAVRSVGPNLVISLLMDGPQLETRWASRHATTLAEDPGSSVLTLTSLAMSQLSRPGKGPSRGRVIALWKEQERGTEEIELPPDYQAAVLSLTTKRCLDWSADGRNRESEMPSLSGVRFVRFRDGSQV